VFADEVLHEARPSVIERLGQHPRSLGSPMPAGASEGIDADAMVPGSQFADASAAEPGG
jgi:hypothetical protein